MIILSVYFKEQRGGLFYRLSRLLRALADRGHTIHYIAIQNLSISHPNVIPHIIRIPFSNSKGFLFWSTFIVAVPVFALFIAFKYRANIIIVFSSFYSFICGFAALLLRITMITFVRADVLRLSLIENKSSMTIFLHSIFEHIGLKLSYVIVANSNSLKLNLESRIKSIQVTVLPNNIDGELRITNKERGDLRKRYDLAKDEFLIVTAGLLNKHKNISFLMKAFSQDLENRSMLIIIGSDIEKTGEGKRLEALARDLGIEDRLRFIGWLADPRELISACDLYVLPSLHEGSPNSLLEALSCNVPCIGSKIPEIKELLKYEQLLFSLEDTKELADKIHMIAKDPVFNKELLELSSMRKKAYSFDWDMQSIKIIFDASENSRN